MRQISYYSYARLVCYDRNYKLVPDILESWDDDQDKVFTLHLRKGMKWSDGKPFTTEDFRYYWEDVANNKELMPSGPPKDHAGRRHAAQGRGHRRDDGPLLPGTKPNADFLPALAAAGPLYLYAPSHYLKKFHAEIRRCGRSSPRR